MNSYDQMEVCDTWVCDCLEGGKEGTGTISANDNEDKDLPDGEKLNEGGSMVLDQDDQHATNETEQSKRMNYKRIDFKEELLKVNEALAFLDYSFERAFTMQEKQCTAAYAVSFLM